jgi:hypothetical protein
MSDYYKFGDIVQISDDISLPKNDLTPLMWVICDCSQDEPIAYIPYRVYAGDTVIVKSIMEGYALIPEDMSTTGGVNGGSKPACWMYAVETVVNRVYWTNPDTGKYELYKKEVRGGQVVAHEGNIVINVKNAYEYIDIDIDRSWGHTGVGGNESMDFLDMRVGMGPSPPYNGFPIPQDQYHTRVWRYWPYWTRTATGVRINVYPGLSGGNAGKSSMDGGGCELWFSFEVGGGGYYTRWEGPDYKVQERSITFTFQNTGRYGNYQ